MTRALAALHDSTYGGVYYSTNIDFTNSGVQPTWTKLTTTGLANTLIKVMQNDPYDPYGVIYVQLDNGDVYRGNGIAAWTKIIDQATINTKAGFVGDLGNIYVDQSVAGKICITTCEAAGFGCSVLRSTDYGATWTNLPLASVLYTSRAYIAVHGTDYHVCVGSIYRSIHYSSGGALWTDYSIWGTTGGGEPVRVDIHNPTRVYYRASAASYELISEVLGVVTTLQAGKNLGSDYHDRHWIDPITSGHQRILRNYSNEIRLFATNDDWTTLVDGSPALLKSTSVPYAAFHCARENDDYMMYGYQNPSGAVSVHHVWAINGETSATTWGIAGTNYNTPPYTNAIPSASNSYIAVQGIWVGEGPASSGVYTYASEYGDDITTLTSEPVIPMPGDRSSWFDLDTDADDASNPFSYYHAQDIADETPQRHAPWSVPAPAAGYGIVSDGTHWVISSDELALVGDLHDPVTLDVDAALILDLQGGGQEIGLDVQNANTVFAGPATAPANEPTFRALVKADLPAIALDDLSDVDMTGIINGQVPTFDSGTSTYKPSTPVSTTTLHEHIINEDHSSECNGVTTSFPTALIFRVGSTQVYINGLRQRLATHYNENATFDGIDIVDPPETGDELIIDYICTYADYLTTQAQLLDSDGISIDDSESVSIIDSLGSSASEYLIDDSAEILNDDSSVIIIESSY